MRAAFMRWGLAVFVVMGVLAPARPASALDGPNITVGDVTVSEGDVGPAVITVPVDLSSASNSTVTVQYTVYGDPTGAGDVPTTTGKLTFQIGVTEKLIRVRILGDTKLENNGVAEIDLSVPVHAQIVDGVGEVLVRDDDSTATKNAVSIGDATVIEADSGTHYAYVPVTLSVAPPVGTTVKVQVLAACGTAGDPARASQNITFLAGQRVKTLKYPVVADKNPENTEVAYKRLKGVKLGNTVVTVPRGVVTIDDNDPGTPPSPPPEPPPLGDNDLISQSSDGQLATFAPTCSFNGSWPAAISDDGNSVLFASSATNLVPDDTNYVPDLFVRDRTTGVTERVDVTNDGSELVNGAGRPFMSADGRYVLFQTDSPELARPGTVETFIRDRTAETTTRVDLALPDGSHPSAATVTGMSPDGRLVAFFTQNPATLTNDVYLYDLTTNTTKWIAPSLSGWYWTPMTDNGEIAFVSSSSTLVPGDTNNYSDIFVENIATGAIDRVNLTSSGAQESGNTWGPPGSNAAKIAISRDGRYVAFWSASANMGVAPKNSAVFLRDRVAGTTERASVLPYSYPYCYSQNEGVSNDGRYVSFSVLCENAQTTAQVVNTSFRDRLLGTTTQVDALPDGTPANAFSGDSVMSADGKWVAYDSGATNLVPGDTNQMMDVFIRKIS
jgi:hypothetical protein